MFVPVLEGRRKKLSVFIGIIFALIGCGFAFGSMYFSDDAKANQTKSDSDYSTYFIREAITGTNDTMIRGGDWHDFLSGVGFTPEKKDWDDGVEYQVIVTNVENEKGSSYTYHDGDLGFIPTKNDDGKTYIVHYQLQKRTNNGNWVDCEGVTATKNFTVYAVNETYDEIGEDEAYIKSLVMFGCSDGTGPWDGDDTPGNDSNDSNGIIRSYDTATYNIAYTTAGYELGTSYRNAYINFAFVLPFDKKDVTFDTDAMNWMSTDTDHMWEKTQKTDSNGNEYQILTCSKRIISQDDSTSAVPGSGEIYLTIRVHFPANGTKITPIVRAYMDGNKISDNSISLSDELSQPDLLNDSYGSCSTHNRKEIAEAELKTLTVSATPSYNITLVRGTNNNELGGSFDFSTGDADSPNKYAGIVRGRLIKYGVRVELANKTISSGPDKGKSKYLRGIEMPSGPITFNIDASTIYNEDSGSSIDLSGDSKYTPLLWTVTPNGVFKTSYGRDLGTISMTDTSQPLDNNNKRTVANDGLQNPISYEDGIYWGTGYCWNGGRRTGSQSGRTITLTIDNYDINPLWFPNANAWARPNVTTYYDPSQGVFSSNRGIFNATEMYIVVPYGNGDNYLPTKYGETGTIQLRLEDHSLQATSISGQTLEEVDDNSNQAVLTDDLLTDTVHLSQPGTFSNYIWYSPADKPNSWCGSMGGADDYNFARGTDSVVIGKDIGTYFGVRNIANGEITNAVQAADALLKFDSSAFSIKDAFPTNSTSRVLYATKKDGTAWSNDNEMMNTNIEDLIYYESLDAVKADGKTCIGLMAEFREDPKLSEASQMDAFAAAVLTANDDPNMVGHVGQIVIESNAWYARSQDDESVLPSAPSRLDVQNGTASESDYAKNRFAKNKKDPYYKTEYDENNVAILHTGGIGIGDSCLLMSYKSKIAVSTAQENANGTTKDIYDLDNNQYSVDYELTPSIDAGEKILSGTTTATIEVTLPEGLEYTNDSGYLGGEYIKSTLPGYEGTVNNGEKITPSVTKNKNGETILTWVINDFPLTGEIPKLHFNAIIDSLTKRNTNFNVTAKINTTEDQRACLVYNGNYSNYTITTAKTADISVQTKAEKAINDAETDLTYTMDWSNNSTNDLKNQIMLVIPPQNGDKAGTRYNGDYNIKDIHLTGTAKTNSSEYQIWYTTDTGGSELTTSDNGLTIDEIREGTSGGVTWKSIILDENGVANIPANEKITAWCILGTLPGRGSVNASVTLDVSGNKSSNRYVNTIWIANSTTQASCYIVTRELNGIAWLDANVNGRRDQDEERLQGIRATLCDSNGNTVYTLDGQECSTITDVNGEYSFVNLPSGTFHVVFDDGGIDISKYRQTIKHASGIPEIVNNDAGGEYSEDGTLVRGITDEIIMPDTDNIISTPYVVNNIDAGYINSSSINLPITGGIGLGILGLLIGLTPVSIIAFARGYAHEIGRKKESINILPND